MLRLLPFFVAALLACKAGAQQVQIFNVSPRGPLPSLTAARDAVRTWRAGEGKGEEKEVHVVIADGAYTVTEPITFEPQDGGKPPVIYMAAPGAHPVISGGKRITGWKKLDDGLWAAEIPEVKEEKWYFQDLWINGRRATRARSPNTGYFHAVQPAQENYGDARPMEKPEWTAFFGKPEETAVLGGLRPQELEDAEVVVYQTWQIARHRIAYADIRAGYLQFTAPSRWPFLLYEPRQRYVIENVRSALDAPGEWFLSRSGTLLYKPLPGEDMAKAEVVAPVADALLVVRGDAHKNQWVNHLWFRGLSFQHSRFELPKEGHIDGQGDSKIPAVVMVDGAGDVRFQDLWINGRRATRGRTPNTG